MTTEDARRWPALVEPTKRETGIGWWFMRKFRRAEVERRAARNDVMQAVFYLLDTKRASKAEDDVAFNANLANLRLLYDRYVDVTCPE